MIKRTKFFKSLEFRMLATVLVAYVLTLVIILSANLTPTGLRGDIIAIFLGCIFFTVVIMLFMGSITERVIRLSKDAKTVGNGDLDHEIKADGQDELGVLAEEMDSMRRSIIEKMGNESRAWQANSELITAISHDIRTPMTSMIGYLDLLKDSNFEDKEQCMQFASSALDKAYELKDLTDTLFKYFLAFGKSGLDLNCEYMGAGILLGQMVSEMEYDMIESGFNVQDIPMEGDCVLFVDPMYLKRVFDNLVSNVRKYADKLRPVVIIGTLEDGKLSISVSNYIAKNLPNVESTKIGMQTCRKIMQQMGGDFVSESDSERFTAVVTLPAVTPPEGTEVI